MAHGAGEAGDLRHSQAAASVQDGVACLPSPQRHCAERGHASVAWNAARRRCRRRAPLAPAVTTPRSCSVARKTRSNCRIQPRLPSAPRSGKPPSRGGVDSGGARCSLVAPRASAVAAGSAGRSPMPVFWLPRDDCGSRERCQALAFGPINSRKPGADGGHVAWLGPPAAAPLTGRRVRRRSCPRHRPLLLTRAQLTVT